MALHKAAIVVIVVAAALAVLALALGLGLGLGLRPQTATTTPAPGCFNTSASCTSNLQCINSVCQCATKYTWNVNSQKCVCISPSASTPGSTSYGTPTAGTTNFTATIASLKSMTVHWGQYVYAIEFAGTNGVNETHGNTGLVSIRNTTVIELVNKKVIAIAMRAGGWIDAFQFQLEDRTTGNTSWTPNMGGTGGSPVYLDVNTIAPNSETFEMSTFSGTVNAANVYTIVIGSLYTVCP